MFHLYPLIPFFFVALRLSLTLPVRWPLKLACIIILLLIVQQNFFFRYLAGGISSPSLPPWVLLALRWSLAVLVLFFILLLCHDLVAGLLWLSRRAGISLSLPFPDHWRLAGLLLLACILASGGAYQALRVPDVRSTEIWLPNLPKELDGLNLVQISDLHADTLRNAPKVRAIADKVNALRPDLILFTGDMIDGTVSARLNDVKPLAELRARYGIFGCLGNHEYYSGLDAWLKQFARLGLTMLVNSHITLVIKGQTVVIAGVADPMASRYHGAASDIEIALRGASQQALRILLAHRPGEAEKAAAMGVDLQLSGHTHGGQIRGFDLIVKLLNQGFVRGWYRVGHMALYVAPGVGLWNGFPVRLGVPAEITHIILRSSQRVVSPSPSS